jgi:hypothetical protein
MRMRFCIAVFQILALLLSATAWSQSLDRYRGSLPKGTHSVTGVDLADAPDPMRPLLRAFLSEDALCSSWAALASSASVDRPVTGALLVAGPNATNVVAIEMEGLSDGEWVRVEALLRIDGFAQERRGKIWTKQGAPSVVRLGAHIVATGDPALVKQLQRPRRAKGSLAAAVAEIPSPAVAWHVETGPDGPARGHVVAGSGLLIDVALPATTPEAAIEGAERWKKRLATDELGAEFESSPAALAILRGGKVKPLGSSIRLVFTANSAETEAALSPLLAILDSETR